MIGVIGGGIIGLSIAWRLAQRGMAVTVYNAGDLGGEASPAGAGMLAPGGEFTTPSVWMQLGLESHALYPAYVAELTAETGCTIDFRLCGAVDFAETPEGIYYPNEGYVDPRHMLAALRVACVRRAVAIKDGERVPQIESQQFEALIIAAGAWSGSILVTSNGRRLTLPATIPVKGHLLGFNLAPGSLPRMRRHGHTYILQRSTGFTIVGSNEERIGFDNRVDAAICRDIHQRASLLWPALANLLPSECWIGFRPATEDLLPKIGRFENTNVWLAYGHYRNGILLAPVTADRIAADITSSLGKG